MLKRSILVTTCLLASTATWAQTTPEGSETNVEASAETEQKSEAAVDPDANKEICRRFREIGSRIAHRKVCKTKAEWEADRAANADVLRNSRGAGGPQLGNGG